MSAKPGRSQWQVYRASDRNRETADDTRRICVRDKGGYEIYMSGAISAHGWSPSNITGKTMLSTYCSNASHHWRRSSAWQRHNHGLLESARRPVERLPANLTCTARHDRCGLDIYSSGNRSYFSWRLRRCGGRLLSLTTSTWLILGQLLFAVSGLVWISILIPIQSGKRGLLVHSYPTTRFLCSIATTVGAG